MPSFLISPMIAQGPALDNSCHNSATWSFFLYVIIGFVATTPLIFVLPKLVQYRSFLPGVFYIIDLFIICIVLVNNKLLVWSYTHFFFSTLPSISLVIILVRVNGIRQQISLMVLLGTVLLSRFLNFTLDPISTEYRYRMCNVHTEETFSGAIGLITFASYSLCKCFIALLWQSKGVKQIGTDWSFITLSFVISFIVLILGKWLPLTERSWVFVSLPLWQMDNMIEMSFDSFATYVASMFTFSYYLCSLEDWFLFVKSDIDVFFTVPVPNPKQRSGTNWHLLRYKDACMSDKHSVFEGSLLLTVFTFSLTITSLFDSWQGSFLYYLIVVHSLLLIFINIISLFVKVSNGDVINEETEMNRYNKNTNITPATALGSYPPPRELSKEETFVPQPPLPPASMETPILTSVPTNGAVMYFPVTAPSFPPRFLSTPDMNYNGYA